MGVSMLYIVDQSVKYLFRFDFFELLGHGAHCYHRSVKSNLCYNSCYPCRNLYICR